MNNNYIQISNGDRVLFRLDGWKLNVVATVVFVLLVLAVVF